MTERTGKAGDRRITRNGHRYELTHVKGSLPAAEKIVEFDGRILKVPGREVYAVYARYRRIYG